MPERKASTEKVRMASVVPERKKASAEVSMAWAEVMDKPEVMDRQASVVGHKQEQQEGNKASASVAE